MQPLFIKNLKINLTQKFRYDIIYLIQSRNSF